MSIPNSTTSAVELTVYKFQAKTGKLLWRSGLGATRTRYENINTPRSIAISQHMVFVSTCQRMQYNYNASILSLHKGNGSLAWGRSNVVNNAIASPPLYDPNLHTVIVALQDQLLSLDADTGRMQWVRNDLPNYAFGAMPISYGHDEVFFQWANCRIYSFSRTNGSTLRLYHQLYIRDFCQLGGWGIQAASHRLIYQNLNHLIALNLSASTNNETQVLWDQDAPMTWLFFPSFLKKKRENHTVGHRRKNDKFDDDEIFVATTVFQTLFAWNGSTGGQLGRNWGVTNKNGTFPPQFGKQGILPNSSSYPFGATVIVPTTRGRLYGVDPISMKAVWTFRPVPVDKLSSLELGAAGEPLVQDGVMYVVLGGDINSLYAIQIEP